MNSDSTAITGIEGLEQKVSELNGHGHQKLVALDFDEFLRMPVLPRETILSPWLFTQSINMVHAIRGVGKTHFALGIAYAASTGGDFLRWKAPKPVSVVYIDGEMPASSVQERLRAIQSAGGLTPDVGKFTIITPDLQDKAMPDLATEEGQEEINAVIESVKAELIIVDNISCLVRGQGKENDAESWLPVQQWSLRMRTEGRSILFIHHSGKGSTQRGTSKREDLMDIVIALRRPSGSSPTDGAIFEVHFEKNRGIHGDDVESFEAALQTDEQGRQTWAMRSVNDATSAKVIALLDDEWSQKDIAAQLDIKPSTVSYHVKKAGRSKGTRKQRKTTAT